MARSARLNPCATDASISRSNARKTGFISGSTFAVSSSRPAANGSSPNNDAARSIKSSVVSSTGEDFDPKTRRRMKARMPIPTATPTNIPIWVLRPPLSQSVQVSSIPLSFSIRFLQGGSGPETMLRQASVQRRNVYAQELRGSMPVTVCSIHCPGQHLALHLGEHFGQRLTTLELLIDVDEAQLVGVV